MQKEDRKFEILYAIIRDYIRTAEPVGSRSIEKKHKMGISSATIRNEMSDLEEMGYLVQPHASSGRIPTEKAYRLYVDRFMKVNDLDDETALTVRAVYEKYMGELEESIKKTAQILTKLTSYTAMISTPKIYSSTVKEVRLLPIEKDRVFLFVVTRNNLVKSAEIRLSFSPSQPELEKVGNFLTLAALDSEAEFLIKEFGEKINELSTAEQTIISQIVPAVDALLRTDMQTRVLTDGITEILNYPEFQNMSRVRLFLDTMHRQDLLAELLAIETQGQDFAVKIGSENELEELADCSILTATYKLNGRPFGTVGLVGPTRMDYDKCISILNALTNELSKHIDISIGGESDDD